MSNGLRVETSFPYVAQSLWDVIRLDEVVKVGLLWTESCVAASLEEAADTLLRIELPLSVPPPRAFLMCAVPWASSGLTRWGLPATSGTSSLQHYQPK